MPRTSCKVYMEFADTTAVADRGILTEANAGIGNAELLRENAEYPLYAMLDSNSFLLDGSRRILQEETKIPFVSTEASKDDCIFENNPVIIIEFTKNHTSAGITLNFIEDYPAELVISWYDLNGAKIVSSVFYPDDLRYFCRSQIENYGRIEIAFTKTRRTGQCVKLGGIQYGTVIEWGGNEIKSASLSEEVDVTSATLPINTAEISVMDYDNDFDLSNQNGAWKSVQKRQALTIKEEVGSNQVTMGTLYLDTWKVAAKIVSLSLIDTLGLMDKTKFYDGQIYTNVAAGEIIDSIMSSAGILKYSISDEVSEILLTGHIAICTHREALQQVLFACGAVADCSRTGGIDIYMPDRHADSAVGPDRKFTGTTIEVDDYVSGVAITYNQYILSDEVQEIYKDVLPKGSTLIEFSEPHEDINVSGGNLIETTVNYAIINMAEAGECIITGSPYKKTEITYTAKVESLKAGEEQNTLSYSGCTMFNIERVKEVAKYILDYYQLRQIVTMRYLIDKERTGTWVNIRDVKGSIVSTGINSQTIDLTGGFIATAKCRGYSKVVTDYIYAGEIYAGERGLI